MDVQNELPDSSFHRVKRTSRLGCAWWNEASEESLAFVVVLGYTLLRRRYADDTGNEKYVFGYGSFSSVKCHHSHS